MHIFDKRVIKNANDAYAAAMWNTYRGVFEALWAYWESGETKLEKAMTLNMLQVICDQIENSDECKAGHCDNALHHLAETARIGLKQAMRMKVGT